MACAIRSGRDRIKPVSRLAELNQEFRTTGSEGHLEAGRRHSEFGMSTFPQ